MTKTDLHRLVDQLPDWLVGSAIKALEAVQEAASLVPQSVRDAPVDDEPLTPEEEAAIEEAWDDVRQGLVHSTDEVRRELGL